ncbi:trehalose-phosphatase [Flexivirga sp. ID2601S]|uniref:Trehalose 6-phosphate phosphatase n=1 Tax=Flexivirga aerilata TaxID=1656889 RepID=A0A849AF59_9MICO|nr:trehalose-phosphatase [Flexivirga aerilata]NNG37818.1 trehalose-phosphatase [Flexivirga aerilata]
MSEATLPQALSAYAARSPILLATDFDGVLAPLVQDPSTSRPVDGSIDALRELARTPGVFVAIVSGRDLAALRQLTGVTPEEGITLIGSHGAEPDRDLPLRVDFDDAARERLARATQALEQVVAAQPGTRLEHKPAGVVLHTRGLSPEAADAAATQALAIDLPGVHTMSGKQIVEFSVLPVTKGIALQALAAQDGTVATCYLGDDVTDETAFAVLPADAGNVTIKVGPGPTGAEFRIAGPPEVVAVFQTVLRAVPHDR